ncbi:MAG TPA: proline dehydrogenase family protein [Candidatus Eremiobacteraceae bacterium]|nr:proline dehydrogenase family protein [Candidatus Eremiobacteraceae bacterium]
MMRSALLAAANNVRLQRLVMKNAKRFGAARFVAGETWPEFLHALQQMNAEGFRVAASLLGEDVRSPDEAAAVAQEYRQLLARLAEAGANATVALKLTHLGLLLDPELAYRNIKSILDAAAASSQFVRIDMEQSAVTTATLDIYRRLRADGISNVGTVLQAYLFRTQDDLAALLPLAPNLRLVKGAYLEPPAVAFPKKADVDGNFSALIERSLSGDGFTAIATHDEAIIERSIDFIRQRTIPRRAYEFQMLYGVRPRLQQSLLRRGFPIRIAAPYGSQWYPYFMRRLAERPANLFFFVSSMVRG